MFKLDAVLLDRTAQIHHTHKLEHEVEEVVVNDNIERCALLKLQAIN